MDYEIACFTAEGYIQIGQTGRITNVLYESVDDITDINGNVGKLVLGTDEAGRVVVELKENIDRLNNTIKYVDNYKVTSTGKIAEIIDNSGNIAGTLYKNNQGNLLSYQFKYKTSKGNIKRLDKLVGYLSEEKFIKFDFNIPSDLKGKGIGSLVLDDIIKYYDVKHPTYKGFLGEWHGKNPNYIDGVSDNFKQFKNAIKNGKSKEEAAFETWTGKQMKKHGFTKIKILEDNEKIVLIEFTK